MEDVVAVRFRDSDRGEGCVLTWGRTFDPVDEAPLLSALHEALSSGHREITELRICTSLREARGFEYFYEGVIDFAARVATEPVTTERWKKRQRKRVKQGRSMYLLGRLIDE